MTLVKNLLQLLTVALASVETVNATRHPKSRHHRHHRYHRNHTRSASSSISPALDQVQQGPPNGLELPQNKEDGFERLPRPSGAGLRFVPVMAAPTKISPPPNMIEAAAEKAPNNIAVGEPNPATPQPCPPTDDNYTPEKEEKPVKSIVPKPVVQASPSPAPIAGPKPQVQPVPPKPSTTPAVQPPVQVASSSSFMKTALDKHNYWRAQYGASPLTWSTNQASSAQTWANGCQWGHSHGSVGSYGENIAAGQQDILDVIEDWMNGPGESSSYKASNPVASHFTQIVWKSTTKIGCAYKVCPGIDGLPQPNPIFFVCEYDTGNVYPAENFAANVGSKV